MKRVADKAEARREAAARGREAQRAYEAAGVDWALAVGKRKVAMRQAAKAGLTYTEVGEIFKVTRGHVSNTVNGRRPDGR